MNKRIYLSPPHMGGHELSAINDVFASNWIAPVGPDITAFEKEMCDYTEAPYAVALSSGTAAIHLALLLCGVRPGDDVLCSTFTFAGSVFPVRYCGAVPVFIDSERTSWNMDPELLETVIRERTKSGKKPSAVIAVHLYGQSADIRRIAEICERFAINLIEDAAESVGGFFEGKHTGTFGRFGVFSFNGNKIMTTSGGGMLIGKNREDIKRARYLSTQAREDLPYYEHLTIGYNYRMSNVLAAIGRGQLKTLEKHILRRKEIFNFYNETFASLDAIEMMPIASWGRPNYWLTCILLDKEKTDVTPEGLRLALETERIESRPLWKPMHLQPVFRDAKIYSKGVSDRLFEQGLCLPSGSSLTQEQLNAITKVVKKCLAK